jgi:hypothetical protein
MAQLRVPRPRFEDLTPKGKWTWSYDRDADTLIMHRGAPRKALSVDIDDVWVRIDPETGEILGLEIEDFERVFLVRFPGVAADWRAEGPGAKPQRMLDGWLQALLSLLSKVLSTYQPGQMHMPPPGR